MRSLSKSHQHIPLSQKHMRQLVRENKRSDTVFRQGLEEEKL